MFDTLKSSYRATALALFRPGGFALVGKKTSIMSSIYLLCDQDEHDADDDDDDIRNCIG